MVNAMESGNSPARGASSESAPEVSAFGDPACLLQFRLPHQLELKPHLGNLAQSTASSKLGLTFFTVAAKQPLRAYDQFGPYAAKLAKQPSATTTAFNWKVCTTFTFFLC